VFHLQISRGYCFYHQFHTFRGLLTGQASLGFLKWNLANGTCSSQTEIPNGNFPKVFVNGKRPSLSSYIHLVSTLTTQQYFLHCCHIFQKRAKAIELPFCFKEFGKEKKKKLF